MVNGLANDSFACYMNVVFQTLVHLPGMTEYFLSGQYLVDSYSPTKQDEEELLCDHIAGLFRTYYLNKEKVLDPVDLKAFLAKKASNFDLNTQEDSHEFYLYLLNQLSEELNKSGLISPATKKQRTLMQNSRNRRSPVKVLVESSKSVEATSRKLWQEELAKCSSICSDVLMGQLMSEVECAACRTVSRIFQVFYVLEIPLLEKKQATLAECLENFSQEEIIEVSEGWKCDNCKVERQAKKRTLITRLPKVLMIYYKRFVFKDKAFVRNQCKVVLNLEGEKIPVQAGESQNYTVFSVTVGLSNKAPSRFTACRALHSNIVRRQRGQTVQR